LCFAQLPNSTSSRSSIFGLSTKRLTSTLNDIIYNSFIVIIIIAHSRYSRLIVIVWAFGGPPPPPRHFRPPPRLCKWRPARHRPSIFSLLSIYRVFGTSAEFIHLFLFVSRRTFVRPGVVRGVAARPPPPGVDTSGEVLLRTLFDNFNKKTSTLIGKVQCWLVRSSLERCYEGGKAPGCFFSLFALIHSARPNLNASAFKQFVHQTTEILSASAAKETQ
jgi:hypothetical protein